MIHTPLLFIEKMGDRNYYQELKDDILQEDQRLTEKVFAISYYNRVFFRKKYIPINIFGNAIKNSWQT